MAGAFANSRIFSPETASHATMASNKSPITGQSTRLRIRKMQWGLYTLAMQEIEINLRRLSPLAIVPAYHSALAAGMDLHAAIAEPVTIDPGSIAMIPCGFALEIPAGFEGQVRPRSGLASKYGVSIPNSPGTVDADYRGEMKVALINLGRNKFTVEPSMRIAQLVIAPVTRARLRETAELSETARGSGGFGSTGG